MNFSKQLLIAALAIAPATMIAAPVTSDPSLSVEGYNFSGFTCSMSKGGAIATPSNCGEIQVATTLSPGVGLQISSGFTAADGSFDDAVIGYHLSSSTGVSSIGLDFNGYFLGMGISSVTESVYSDGTLVGSAKVSCASPEFGGGCNQTDTVLLNGTYTNLFVQKDINVTGAVDSSAQASVIDQTFTATPEPSSLALMGSGLAGTLAMLRRRAKKVAAQA